MPPLTLGTPVFVITIRLSSKGQVNGLGWVGRVEVGWLEKFGKKLSQLSTKIKMKLSLAIRILVTT